MEHNRKGIFNVKDREKIANEIKLGKEFPVIKRDRFDTHKLSYVVIDKYEHYALCVDNYGRRKCFNWFDLLKIMNGEEIDEDL